MTGVAATIFRNVGAATKEEAAGSLEQLAWLIRHTTAPTRLALPLLKLARFGNARSPQGSLRHDVNLTRISGIEGDYDAGEIGIDAAVRLLNRAHVAALVYTTARHTIDAPRWRVLCPCSTELLAGERDRLVDRLHGVLGGILAPESWTLSQAYFYGAVAGMPAPRVEIVDGRSIDLCDELDALAVGKPGSTPRHHTQTCDFQPSEIGRLPAPTTIEQEVAMSVWRELVATVARWSPEESHARVSAQSAARRLAALPIGQGLRNRALNGEAYALGRQVARGWISAPEAILWLWVGAQGCRYDRDHGTAATIAVIRSGLGAGLKDPYPDLRYRPEPAS
jgi:hypothetical protein